ncbi:MAG: hypothetical protein QNK30_03185 [Bacteroidales bacterium]|nr:hypothetical protein [Bacteroidales bacterium]
MKYRRIHIALIVLGFTLWGAPTCQEPDPWEYAQVQQNEEIILDEETVVNARKDIIEEIEKEFEASALQEDQLLAFEERGKDKLQDLADYLNILSNKDFDVSFRNQARKMIMVQFIEESQVDSELLGLPDDPDYNLFDFLDEINTMEYGETRFVVNEIRITDSLEISESGVYSGSISFSRKVFGKTGQDSLLISSGDDKIDIILQRAQKVFGNDTLNVWGVKFGDIQ